LESYFGAELALLATGALAGAVHIVSPDHWVAMLPISMDARERGWRVGLQWGLGHALGLTSVGLAAYGIRDWFDLSIVTEGSGHWILAGVLIAVGSWGLVHARASHGHAPHGSGFEPVDPQHGHGHAHTVMAFGVGALHGISGTGAFLVVIPALGLDGWLKVSMYLLGFGNGTVLAMVAFSALLGTFAARIASDRRFERLFRRCFEVVCWATIAVGVILITLPEHLHVH